MHRLTATTPVLAAAALLSGSAFAHHSMSMFDMSKVEVIEGKVAKWIKEVCLVEQPSVLESDKSVDQLRKEVAAAAGGDVTLVKFVRFECGEGVEKPQGDDFAAEVAKMAKG